MFDYYDTSIRCKYLAESSHQGSSRSLWQWDSQCPFASVVQQDLQTTLLSDQTSVCVWWASSSNQIANDCEFQGLTVFHTGLSGNWGWSSTNCVIHRSFGERREWQPPRKQVISSAKSQWRYLRHTSFRVSLEEKCEWWLCLELV